MKIKADKEGKAVLIQICDMARKICDLNCVGNILTVINAIEEIPEEKKPKKQEKKPKKTK